MPESILNDADPQWELCKENAAPLPRGRNVESLSRALGPGSSACRPQRKDEDDCNIRQFESLVRPSERFSKQLAKQRKRELEGKNSIIGNKQTDINVLLEKCKVDKDPIVHWLRYIKYDEETYPSDTHGQFLLMERCTRALFHHPRYTNDVRFIRVCILYADKTPAPNDSFKLMHKHEIGVETAVFWMAWAWTAEKRKDFKFAEKVFLKALAKKAKPFKLIEARYKQFQRRMSRHWLNSAPPTEEDKENVDDRGVLAGLTEEGFRKNHRGKASNTMASSFTHKVHPSHGQDRVSEKSNKGEGFAIFADGDKENYDNGYDLNQSILSDHDAIPKSLITKEEHQTKENTYAAEPWNKRGGLCTIGYNEVQRNDPEDVPSVAQRWVGNGSDTRAAGGTSSQQAFQVYVDEECAAKNDIEEEEAQKKREHERKYVRQGMGKVNNGASDVQKRYQSLTNQTRASYTQAESKYDTHKTLNLKRKIGRKDIDNPSLYYDKNLVTNINKRKEICFEESRAYEHYYKIVPPDKNFNILHFDEELSSMDVEDMSEIQDITMDDTSKSHISVPCESSLNNSKIVAPSYEGTAKSSFDARDMGKSGSKRKVLFGINTSIGTNSISHVQCESLASSTVNEKDAVGLTGEIAEETINTKFAARELSMMFSSPAIGYKNDTSVRASAMRLNDSVSSVKPLFSVVQNKNVEDKVDLKKKKENITPKELNRMGSIKMSDSEKYPKKKMKGKILPSFSIFCDDSTENIEPTDIHSQRNGEISTKDTFQSHKLSKLKIYQESTEELVGINSVNNDVENTETISLSCLRDSKSTPSFDNENGETVETMALLKFEKNDTSAKQSPSNKRLMIKSSKAFNIYREEKEKEDFSNYSKQDDGTVLTEDLIAFGDISHITPADADTISMLEGNMQHMTVSQNNASKNNVNYKTIHQRNTEESLQNLIDEAAKQQRRKCRNSSMNVTIFDRIKTMLPKGLRKVPKKGTEIDIGGFELIVKSFLGRGSNGTVLLCDCATSSRSSFALKVQSPVGCLAWEFEILRRLNLRVSKQKRNVRDKEEMIPYPQVLSFVAFSDGGVLGMTAGSDMGLNLVDLVNTYEEAIPELLAVYYTSKMLLHLETLHLRGKILHCDIKPDNWVLTGSRSCIDSGDCPIGSDLMLVDFGRALDLTEVGDEPFSIRLHGDIAAEDMQCAAMLQNKSWNIDFDTHGVCASAHILLFRCYMDTSRNDKSNRWEPKKKFRRYWQQELWQTFFDTLLNINCDDFNMKVSEYGRKISSVRENFERYLDKSNNRRQVESLLKKQTRKLYKRK